jgi:hypothetical protein
MDSMKRDFLCLFRIPLSAPALHAIHYTTSEQGMLIEDARTEERRDSARTNVGWACAPPKHVRAPLACSPSRERLPPRKRPPRWPRALPRRTLGCGIRKSPARRPPATLGRTLAQSSPRMAASGGRSETTAQTPKPFTLERLSSPNSFTLNSPPTEELNACRRRVAGACQKVQKEDQKSGAGWFAATTLFQALNNVEV